MKDLLTLLLLCTSLTIAQNVGVGTATPDPTAKLDVSSTSSGFLPPRLTTAQRNAIASPAEGLVIYNVETHCLNFYNGTKWVESCADVAPCSPPPASTPASNSPLCSGETLNLTATPVGGATYVWSGPDGFSSTTQNPTLASVTTAKAGAYQLRTWALGCYSDVQSTNVAITQNNWTRKADYPGTALYLPAGFASGSTAYVGTGSANWCAGAFTKDIYAYNASTNTWSGTPVTSFGGGAGFTTYATSGFGLNGKGYFVGGGGTGCAGTQLNTTYEYDPATGTWTLMDNFGGGNRYSTFSNVTLNGKLYYGLGATFACVFQDFWVFDPAAGPGGTWTQLANYPPGIRGGSWAFAVNDSIYVGGGNWAVTCGTGSSNSFYRYDPATNTWAARVSGPPAGGACAAWAIGSYGYVLGTNKVVYRYNPTTNVWDTVCAYPGAAAPGLSAAVVIAGKAYVFNTNSRETWEFTP